MEESNAHMKRPHVCEERIRFSFSFIWNASQETKGRLSDPKTNRGARRKGSRESLALLPLVKICFPPTMT